MTLPLSSHGALADARRSWRVARRKLKLHSGVNSESWEWRENKQYLVYDVFAVYCSLCMLYSVYGVLGVDSWSCHWEIKRDDFTLCSAMIVELWTRIREMGDEDRNDVEDTSGYEKSRVRLPRLCWVDHVDRCNYTPDHDAYLLYGDGQLTRTPTSLKS